MKLRRTTSYKIMPLVLMCVIALVGLTIYLNTSSIQTNPLNLTFPDESATVKPHTLAVKVNADGKFLYKETLVDINELKKLVQQDVEKFEDHKKVTIVITVEKDIPIKYVVSIMDMATKMEVSAILATEPN